MTRRSTPSLAAALLAMLAAGCADHHVALHAATTDAATDDAATDDAATDDAAPDAGAPDDASALVADAGPRTCNLVEGIVRLTPDAANPPGCTETVGCRVWFGHGQHLSCPEDGGASPSFAGCSIWDCLCVDGDPEAETERFVADFSTGEVVDTRNAARACRYTIEPSS